MIAALQALCAQEIGYLIGAPGKRGKREFCLAVAAGIYDPQRRAVAAFGIARQLRIEPVQRPVERHWIGPAETLHRRIVVGPMPQQKGARFLETRHFRSSAIASVTS